MPLQSFSKRRFQDSYGVMLRVSAYSLLLLIGTCSVIATEQVPICTFCVLSNDELASIQPDLEEKYFKHGNPHRYRRHRVLRIEVENFRSLLKSDWASQKENTHSSGVLIPLFADYSITVRVDSWIDGNFGVTGVSGTSDDLSSIVGSFNAHFIDGGLAKASVSMKDGLFLISPLSDYIHYVVFEFDPMGAID